MTISNRTLSTLGVDTLLSTLCVRGQSNVVLALNDTIGNILWFSFGTVPDDDNANTSTYWALQQVKFETSSGASFANASNYFFCHYNQSFQCQSQEDILLTSTSSNTSNTIVLSIVGWKVQAFSFSNQTFDVARHCVKDYQSSIIVPIVVGAAMAGLIALVLIAYVISQIRNWRSQRSSYNSYGRL